MFSGNWATLIIPWDSRGRIDKAALQEEIEILISCNVDGIYSCGSAGEFHLLLENEFFLVNEILSDLCQKKHCPFQIGASHANPFECISRIEKIISLHPAGIQVIAPDWWYALPEVTIRFLRKIVEITQENIPLILYNPPHAKTVYSFEEIMQIKNQVDMLKGIKVLGGDEKWYKNMRNLKGDSDLSVFIPGHVLATGIKNGAHGSYSNVCCINPYVAQRWSDRIKNSEWDIAFDIEKRLNKFMDDAIAPFIKRGIPNYTVDRAMAVAGEWGPIKENNRWPYIGPNKDEITSIRKKGKDIIPEFFV